MQQPERMHRKVETWPSTSNIVGDVVKSILAQNEMRILPEFSSPNDYIAFILEEVQKKVGDTTVQLDVNSLLVGGVIWSMIYEYHSLGVTGETTEVLDLEYTPE